MKAKTIAMICALLPAVSHVLGQSDSIQAKAEHTPVSLQFAFNYGMLQASTSAFLVSDSLGNGSVSPVSAPGMSAGVFYEGRIAGERSEWTWRAGVELQYSGAFLEYDKKKKNKEEYAIHPLSAQLPIQFAWYKNPVYRNVDLELYSRKKSSVAPVLGLRPGFPLGFASSVHPELNDYFVYADLGAEMSFKLKSNVMTLQLTYGRDLLQRLATGSSDEYNKPVSDLFLHQLNLRASFF